MKYLTNFLALFILLAPTLIFAQVAQTLVELPGDIKPGADGFTSYINYLYALSISVAALLAVIKIIIAGAKYMLTDIAPNKGAAISEIKGALLGLLLILAAVLILTVINPKLLKSTLKFDPQPDLDYKSFKFSPITSSNPGSGGTSGGGTATNPDGTPKVGLVQPGQSYKDHTDLDQKFISTSGNVVKYNIAAACDAKTSSVSSNKQGTYDLCIQTQAPIYFKKYCYNNYGNEDKSGDFLTCELPTKISDISKLTAEFDKYKSTDPSLKYKSLDELSDSQEEAFCKSMQGTYKNNYDSLSAVGASDDKCAWYN